MGDLGYTKAWSAISILHDVQISPHPLMTIIPSSAWILAGGQSRRFGSPKGGAVVAGQTLLDRAWDLCSPIFRSTCLVTKRNLGPVDRPAVLDLVNAQSPLSGIYSALQTAESEWVFILSCDLPLIEKKVIHRLWKSTAPDLDVVLPQTSRGLEPTCAFYSKNSLPFFRKMISTRTYALHQLIPQLRYTAIDFSDNDEFFFNVNTPEELEEVGRILERMERGG